MDKVIIQQATIRDIYLLQTLGMKTFLETFADTNSDKDMQSYLKESFSKQQLTQELNHAESAFYMAWYAETPIGYLKINWGNAQNEFQQQDGLEIQRIYVLREFHGKSVGQSLYDTAIEIAHQKRVKYVWLGVWEHNYKALRFYEKNGFNAFDEHVFMLGNDRQVDILMKKPLPQN